MALFSKTGRPSRSPAARPYDKLLRVKLRSGRTYLLSSELWDLLPKDDAVISVIDALRCPVFAVIDSHIETTARLNSGHLTSASPNGARPA